MASAILKTLAYHDLFDYPLTQSEIHQFLIGNSKLKLKIQNLIKKGKIEKKNDFFFLKGREDIVKLRKKREEYSRRKFLIAERVVNFLCMIPTIKMVALTGAVAVGNAQRDDDIDFLIVTARNRLWLTRIQAVLLIELLGKRRRPMSKKVTDKICLNIFLDEKHLTLPRHKRNLFTAHEIGQMKVLWQQDQFYYSQFLQANQWLKKFLPNWRP